jgi:hypothetical protein
MPDRAGPSRHLRRHPGATPPCRLPLLVIAALEQSYHLSKLVSNARAFFPLRQHWTDLPPPCVGPDDTASQATTIIDPVAVPATTSQEQLNFLSPAISSSSSHRSSTPSSSLTSRSPPPPSVAVIYPTRTSMSHRILPSSPVCHPPCGIASPSRVLAAAAGLPWASWGTVCPSHQHCAAGPHAEVGP